MDEGKKLFDAEFETPLYEIKITVKKNCSMFRVNVLKEGFDPSYGDVIGYLEINKQKLIWEQTGFNIEKQSKRKRSNPKTPKP
jgi:hypothetical protein